MKKVLFFMMLGLAVCSCSNDEGVVLPGENNGYFEAGVFNRNNPTSRAAVVAEPQYFVVYK